MKQHDVRIKSNEPWGRTQEIRVALAGSEMSRADATDRQSISIKYKNTMDKEVRMRHSLSRRIIFTTLLIFFVSIWALSYYASRTLRQDMERLLADQQSAA